MMSSKKEARIEVLKLMRERKEVLMGAFSSTLTKCDKVAAWKEIHALASAMGLVPASKDFVYTRDTFWQNIRKNTMKKLDNRKKTGTGGGAECKLNEIDQVVCDIIGRDSPVLTGLPIQESWDDQHDSAQVNVDGATAAADAENEDNFPGLRVETNNLNTMTYSLGKKKPARIAGSDEEKDLRIKKMKLSIEIMEREKYIKDLEILKLERELLITDCSPYTKNFPRIIAECVEE